MDLRHPILGLKFMSMYMIRQNKLLLASLYLLPFLILYIISALALNELYLFKWLLDRWYLFVWMIAVILAYRQKHFIAISLTIGSILGVPLGQFCGDIVRNHNIQGITASMSPEEVAKRHLHPGVPIWIITVLLSVLVGIILESHYKKSRETY